MLDLLALLIAVTLVVAAFYPGLMNADALTTYAAAVLGAPPNDWHSAFIAYLWRALLAFDLPIVVFTAFQVALYVASLQLIGRWAGLKPAGRLALTTLVMIVPPATTWLVALEKTSFLAVMLAVSFAVALRVRRASLPLFAACSLAGIFARPNGVIIFAPLIVWVCWRALRPQRAILVSASILAAAILLPRGAILAGYVVPSYPQQATMDLDLLNLSFRVGADLLPDNLLLIPFEEARATIAADPTNYDPLQLTLRRMTNARDFTALQTRWLSAIAGHPFVYLKWRLRLFWTYECIDPSRICRDSWHWYTGGIDHNVFGLASRHWQPVFDFYRGLAATLFYRPITYDVTMMVVLAAAVARRRRTTAAYAAALMFYELTNFFFIPSTSVRMVIPLGLMVPFLVLGLWAESPARRTEPACAAAC